MADDSEFVRKYPTIEDVVKELTILMESGLGDTPVRAVVFPAGTLQEIADGAVLMELGSHGGRDPVLVVSDGPPMFDTECPH
jgi:hypothetical protein